MKDYMKLVGVTLLALAITTVSIVSAHSEEPYRENLDQMSELCDQMHKNMEEKNIDHEQMHKIMHGKDSSYREMHNIMHGVAK